MIPRTNRTNFDLFCSDKKERLNCTEIMLGTPDGENYLSEGRYSDPAIVERRKLEADTRRNRLYSKLGSIYDRDELSSRTKREIANELEILKNRYREHVLSHSYASFR